MRKPITKREHIPNCPTVNVDRLRAMRKKIIEDEKLLNWVGAVVTPELTLRLSDRLAKLMRIPRTVDTLAIRLSIRALEGSLLEWKIFLRLVWSIAGNRELLIKGIPVLSGLKVLEPTWRMLSVFKTSWNNEKEGKTNIRFDFKVHTGQGAGEIVTTRWNIERVDYFWETVLGGRSSKFWETYPRNSLDDFLDMRFYGLAMPEINVCEFEMKPDCKKHNRSQYEKPTESRRKDLDTYFY